MVGIALAKSLPLVVDVVLVTEVATGDSGGVLNPDWTVSSALCGVNALLLLADSFRLFLASAMS